MFIPSFFVVRDLLTQREAFGSESRVDMDRFSAIELFIEAENAQLSRDMIALKFSELVAHLNKLCFEQEKKDLLADIDPNSTEYIIQHRKLQEKGKSMGIKVNRG